MSYITKVMLASEVKALSIINQQLHSENEQLKEMNKLLQKGHFDLEAFNRMHEGAVTSLAHVIGDLRLLLQDRRL